MSSHHYPHHAAAYNSSFSPYPPGSSTHLPTHPTSAALDPHLHDSLHRLSRGEGNTHQQQQHPHGPRASASISDLRRKSSLHNIQNRTVSRRSSTVETSIRASTSPGPENTRLSRSPSNPTIRKRASMHNLSTTPLGGSATGGSGRLSRKGSLLGLNGSNSPSTAANRPFTPQPPALTAVILHDGVYKHRFVRPGAKKADIANIVERPERINAAVMGICAAQTRLGPHKLSIHKTKRMGSLLDPEVMLVHGGEGGHGASWPKELIALCRDAVEKLRRGECEVPPTLHQGDLYLCGESREALEGCIGACYEAVDAVFGSGYSDGIGKGAREIPTKRAFVCVRPPGHHCAETEPSGFCWINNVHIAIAHAARAHDLTHAVILDIDLHHGDGSQAITWTLNDMLAKSSAKKPPSSPIPRIAYLSLHDINSYPCEVGDMEKVKNASLNLEAHNQFIQNIHLKNYSTAQEFWELYENRYSVMLTKAREYLVSAMESWRNSKAGKAGREPKAALFISAGFDASEHESSGMQRHDVHVPTGFYARFAREAVMIAEDEDTGCGGRVISVLEGGYSNRAMTSGVLAHLVGLSYETPARAMFRHHQRYQMGNLSEEFHESLPEMEYDTFHGTPRDYLGGQAEGFAVDYYDPSWWDIEHLVELENKLSKRPKKVPSAAPVNYLSATVASAAKVETKSQKALQAQAAKQGGPPPPPVVLDWATATVELSKKLIPQEDEEGSGAPPSPTGSVISCRSVSVSGNKRHSVASDVITEGLSKMTLRERKAKPVLEERSVSRASTASGGRRKTVAGVITSPPVNTAGSTGRRAAAVPTIQKIPSRGPSPAPSVASGRRVVSMGMPPPPPRTSSTSTRRLDKVNSVGNMREAAKSSPSNGTPSPPPSRGAQTGKQGTLRRVSSTSTMNTRSAASGKAKPGASTATADNKQVRKKGTPQSSPPKAEPENPDSPGSPAGDNIGDALVKGMKKIRLTYKAGVENQIEQDQGRRVKELEKLAAEKQKEIEQLKKEAREREREKAAAKLMALSINVPQNTNTNANANANGLASPPSAGGAFSAVKLAAMRLESTGPGTQQKPKLQTSDIPAGGIKTPSPVSPNVQSPPQQQSKQQQAHAPKGVQKPVGTKPTVAAVPTKINTANSGPITMTTTTPSPTSSMAPPPPQIITIPPTRPTSSWDADMSGPGGANHIPGHNAPEAPGLLSPEYGFSDSAVYHHHHHHDDVDDIRNASSQVEQERPQEQSPPPPYSAVRGEAVQVQVPGVGFAYQGNNHVQGVTVQQGQALSPGAFGFNVMKPLTVGLGGNVGGAGRGSE
ncbi:histone deacetylase domain-containing protein [Kalaharituber pfeilii]|nr:histone deacetylase domain-containing protein [Kalaharituber pfeilii]